MKLQKLYQIYQSHIAVSNESLSLPSDHMNVYTAVVESILDSEVIEACETLKAKWSNPVEEYLDLDLFIVLCRVQQAGSYCDG